LDANGEAYVSVRVKTGRTYSVGTSKPPNMCYDKSIQYTFGKEDLPNLDFQFEYAECATWQQKIKNINCIDSNDKIDISVQNSVNSLGTNPWILNGCANYMCQPKFQLAHIICNG
jgi:hypothetical protein